MPLEGRRDNTKGEVEGVWLKATKEKMGLFTGGLKSAADQTKGGKDMNRRMVTTGLFILFSILLIAGQAAGQKVRFATSVDQPTYHLPLMAAKEKGLWKEQGIEVEWVPFRSSSILYRALAAGEVDMAMPGTISAVQAIIGGVPQIVVADVKTLYEFYLWVRADSPIKEPKDLKGTKVAVTGLGGLSHAYARVVTRSLGLEKEVRFVAMGGLKEQAAALKTGAAESTVLSFIALAPLKVKGEIRELLLVGDFLPKEWSENSLTVHTGFASRFPREVVKAIKGYFMATDFVQANRDWALEKMKSGMRYEEEVAKAIYPRLKYGREGKINPKALENIVNFLIEFGIVAKEKAPPLEKIYDKSFAEQAAG